MNKTFKVATVLVATSLTVSIYTHADILSTSSTKTAAELDIEGIEIASAVLDVTATVQIISEVGQQDPCVGFMMLRLMREDIEDTAYKAKEHFIQRLTLITHGAAGSGPQWDAEHIMDTLQLLERVLMTYNDIDNRVEEIAASCN